MSLEIFWIWNIKGPLEPINTDDGSEGPPKYIYLKKENKKKNKKQKKKQNFLRLPKEVKPNNKQYRFWCNVANVAVVVMVPRPYPYLTDMITNALLFLFDNLIECNSFIMATFCQILLQKQKQKLHIFWRNVKTLPSLWRNFKCNKYFIWQINRM